MKLITTLLCTVLIAAYSFAGGEIKGKIIDKASKETIPGAHVYVQYGGVKIGTLTDENGKFTIKPLNAGTYDLNISFMGYTPKVIEDVKVNSDKITWLASVDISYGVDLGPGAEVVGWTIPLINFDGGNETILDFKGIEKNPHLKDPAELIATIPGVYKKEGSQQLYFRGARHDASQYFVDGVKTLNGNLGIPSSAIGEIIVYTGGAPAKYGDFTGGIVVVETKSYFDLLNEFGSRN